MRREQGKQCWRSEVLGRMLQATHYLHSVGVVSSPLTSWNFDIYVCVGQEVVAVAAAEAD